MAETNDRRSPPVYDGESRTHAAAAFAALTPRELEVLTLVARGATNREAAAQLFISEATVKTHLLHVYAKLGVNDRASAVAAGYERGLLSASSPSSSSSRSRPRR